LIDTLTEDFRTGLKELDMLPEPELNIPSGLFFVAEEPENDYKDYIKIALENAGNYKATAVYFRHFLNMPPVPQIYIYDYTSIDGDGINEKELGALHRKLWNSGQIPLFFIFTKTEVKIYNCFKPPEFKYELNEFATSPLETIRLASEMKEETQKRKEFSARKFDNGLFWDTSKYSDSFDIKSGVYERLLQELRNIKKYVIDKNILPEKIAKRLLVMLILIKYLEERKDEDGNTVFPKSFLKQFFEVEDLVDVLRKKGAIIELFDYLSNHFNGEIFRWNDEDKELLSESDLSIFAEFLEGKSEGKQLVFWRLYSFDDLPVELISNIYEEFLGGEKKEKGIVYTPSFLVELLIDECMPLNNLQTDFKVMDPACGSGIFLVAAYKRLIYRWRIENKWKKPDLGTLKKLLRDNIYGIDKEEEAIQLTVFSLTVALCDELSPKKIWEDLKFDNLMERNFFGKDFFELIIKEAIKIKFDLVIGNPPFLRKLTEAARLLERQFNREKTIIPNRQIALLFLEQSIKLCKSNALLCFILPSSGLLYNQNSYKFRKYLLQNYNVLQILDFTSLADLLFGSTKVSISSIFIKNEKPSRKKILHAIFRRTKISKEKIYFELDYYDFCYVPHKEALNNKLIWKCNLLGNGRLKHLISRFEHLPKLGDYIESNKERGWVSGIGYFVGDKEKIELLKSLKKKQNLNDIEKKELAMLENKFSKASYLTGERTAGDFSSQGIDNNQIYILEEDYFERPRDERLYKGPHILIKAHTSLPIDFRTDDLCFSREVIGIHSPESETDKLQRIADMIKLNRKLFRFYIASFSGSSIIRRKTAIDKTDIDNLPFPEDEKELELSEIENILVEDTLDYMVDFLRRGEKSRVIQEEVNRKQLEEFSSVYCSILNSVYEKFKAHEPVYTDSFICLPFYYDKKPNILEENLDDFDYYLKKLVFDKSKLNLRIVRNFRFYDRNIIYLIKPMQLRYWLRSIAVRDADETFVDLFEQGY